MTNILQCINKKKKKILNKKLLNCCKTVQIWILQVSFSVSKKKKKNSYIFLLIWGEIWPGHVLHLTIPLQRFVMSINKQQLSALKALTRCQSSMLERDIKHIMAFQTQQDTHSTETSISTVLSTLLMNSWRETERKRAFSQSQARTAAACGLVLPILFPHTEMLTIYIFRLV